MIWHRRVFAFGLMLCLIALSHGAPRAQFNSFPPGVFNNKEALDPAAGGATYTGPGDVVTFNFWCGLRAYTAATAGTKAIRVIRASDSTQQDINTLANGSLDAASLTSFLTSTTGKIVTCYDKVSTNDLTQATDANRPTVTASALGSSYGMTCAAASSLQLVGPNLSPQAQPYYFYAVANWNGVANAGIWAADSGGFAGAIAEFQTTGPVFAVFAGTVLSGSATANAWHAAQSLLNGPTSVVSIDNTETPGNAGTQGAFNTTTAPIRLCNDISSFFSGNVMELGYLAGTVSPTNRTALNSNAHAAYGGW